MNQEEQEQSNELNYETQISVIRTYAVKERNFPSPIKKVKNAKDAAELVKPFLQNADKECLLVCCLDNAGHPLSLEIAAIGVADGCLVGIKEVFKNAVLCNASGILLYHNHPSGEVKPSSDDILTTEKVRKAGELLGILLVDHIIIGDDNRFFSFAGKRKYLGVREKFYQAA